MDRTDTYSIIWFKNDLRCTDNLLLAQAIQESTMVLPIFILDKRLFTHTQYGFPKIGKFRLRFIYECLVNLQAQFEQLGSKLHIYEGTPEQILPELVLKYKINKVYAQKEYAHDELEIEAKVIKLLALFKADYISIDNRLLLDTQSINPSIIENLPNDFETYIAQHSQASKIDTTNTSLPLFTTIAQCSQTNNLHLFHKYLDHFQIDRDIPSDCEGGETIAQQKLHEYIWKAQHIKEYGENKKYNLGNNISSRLSPYYTFGCLSPQTTQRELLRFQQEYGYSDSVQSMLTELQLRDYRHLQFLKYKQLYFVKCGLNNHKLTCRLDYDLLNQWIESRTECAYINAIMKEIATTGWSCYKNRKAAAHYLSKHMRVDWRMGAAYYESVLLDYDVCLNYGNWADLVGITNCLNEEEDIYTHLRNELKDEKYIAAWAS